MCLCVSLALCFSICMHVYMNSTYIKIRGQRVELSSSLTYTWIIELEPRFHQIWRQAPLSPEPTHQPIVWDILRAPWVAFEDFYCKWERWLLVRQFLAFFIPWDDNAPCLPYFGLSSDYVSRVPARNDCSQMKEETMSKSGDSSMNWWGPA